ncbi:MAG: hypothetical protein PWQ09_1713 [Candidatus Cloacimonadota bacterium]|nr:hypothetical protein [Candidatus Cloacimonadota bacterium]
MKKSIFVLFIFICGSLFSDFYPYKLDFAMQPPFSNNATFNIFQPSFFEDYDPQSASTQPILFTVSIQNVATEFQDYEILFNMRWRDLYADAILTPTTQEPVPGQIIRLTNRDILTDSNSASYEIDKNFDDVLKEMEDIIQETGHMPDGSYFFSIQAFEPGHLGEEERALSNIETLTINVNSPTPISLITPGNSLDMGPAKIQDTQPSFVWVSNLSQYRLKIYETELTATNEAEIVATEPYFEESNITGTSYLYPDSAPKLQPGYTYAWQVEAPLSTLGSNAETLKSELYVFTIASNYDLTPQAMQLYNFIEQLDIANKDQVLQLLQRGYKPGKISLNGKEIAISELRQILQKTQTGQIEIKNVTVE